MELLFDLAMAKVRQRVWQKDVVLHCATWSWLSGPCTYADVIQSVSLQPLAVIRQHLADEGEKHELLLDDALTDARHERFPGSRPVGILGRSHDTMVDFHHHVMVILDGFGEQHHASMAGPTMREESQWLLIFAAAAATAQGSSAVP